MQTLQTRENMEPMLNAKNMPCNAAKRAKMCNRYKARENSEPLPSAGKHETAANAAKRGKRRLQQCYDWLIGWNREDRDKGYVLTNQKDRRTQK